MQTACAARRVVGGGPAPGTKRCTSCGELRKTAMFSFTLKGLQSECTSCHTLQSRLRLKEQAARKWQGQGPPAEKRCAKCEYTLPRGTFAKVQGSKDGHAAACWGCGAEAREAWSPSECSVLGTGRPLFLLPRAESAGAARQSHPGQICKRTRSRSFAIRPLRRICAATQGRSGWRRRRSIYARL